MWVVAVALFFTASSTEIEFAFFPASLAVILLLQTLRTVASSADCLSQF
jgi:hypothetical protein